MIPSLADPLTIAITAILEALDYPAKWKGYLVTRFIPPQIHPVSLIYRLASKFAKPGPASRGLAVLIVGVAPPVIASAIYILVIKPSLGIIGSVLEAYFLKLSLGVAHIYYPCLSARSPGEFIWASRQFVRRSLGGDLALARSACIEAMSESLVDSLTSPLLWYLLLGLPGAWAQRAINTLDGLVGFPEFGRAGSVVALADTVVNFLPARLAASMLLLIGALMGMKPKLSVLRHRKRVPSRNAGWPIAAMAAVLGCRLVKQGVYEVGEGELPGHSHVLKAVVMVAVCEYMLFAGATVFTLFC